MPSTCIFCGHKNNSKNLLSLRTYGKLLGEISNYVKCESCFSVYKLLIEYSTKPVYEKVEIFHNRMEVTTYVIDNSTRLKYGEYWKGYDAPHTAGIPSRYFMTKYWRPGFSFSGKKEIGTGEYCWLSEYAKRRGDRCPNWKYKWFNLYKSDRWIKEQEEAAYAAVSGNSDKVIFTYKHET